MQDQIEEIMHRFDFYKVRSVMVHLHWKWGNNQIPSVQDLRSTAHALLCETVDRWQEQGRPLTGTSTATGGFLAQINVFNADSATLELLFYVDWAEAKTC